MQKKDLIAKAKTNPNSRKQAIEAKCWDCMGAGADPGTRWQIGNCLCTDCPLYPFRPYKHLFKKDKPKNLRV